MMSTMLRCVAPTEMNEWRFYWYATTALVVKANVGNVASLGRTPIKLNTKIHKLNESEPTVGRHRLCDCFSFVVDVVALSAKTPAFSFANSGRYELC